MYTSLSEATVIFDTGNPKAKIHSVQRIVVLITVRENMGTGTYVGFHAAHSIF